LQALISVYDKTGLDKISKVLNSLNYEIFSTGGTLKYIKSLGINAISISELTNFKEILGGRVKTLHPNIHAGILADLNNPDHLEDLREYNIAPFDIVINNLYPFEEVLSKSVWKENSKSKDEEIIENIDIGGPSMIRAAAKNFTRVSVLIDPDDYDWFSEKLISKKLSVNDRKKLASKAFDRTYNYDKRISAYLKERSKDSMTSSLNLSLDKITNLRYGENPHQRSAIYSNDHSGVANAKLLHGKEMSYLNFLDADAAFTAANSFTTHCASIVKHTNTCGLSVQDNQLDAYNFALRGDPVSAFGGIIGFNSEIESSTAMEISKTFYDVIIAPSFSKEAFEILSKKKNIRLLSADFLIENYEYRTINGGLLFQEKDNQIEKVQDWEFVTKNKPDKNTFDDLLFAWNATKFIKSNAIVITEGKSILGMGSGQPNRINSVNLALSRAKEFLSDNSILASDAFFPFPDSIDIAAENNIKTILQPGGSLKDDEVVKRANTYQIKMIFTNRRHFSH
tara:strand:+ start:197 stop:1726 length:1530 start_codon:yes stop_codon:yes gene_type:complete